MIRDVIKEIRIELKLSQRALAKEIGISQASIVGYELGTRQPGFMTSKKIFSFIKRRKLKVKFNDIFKQ